MNASIIAPKYSSFARREEWSPPLPLGVPRPMNYCSFLVVVSPSNDNSLSFVGSISFEYCLSYFVWAGTDNHFWCVLVHMGFSINPCYGATAVLCKRPSLLGHFLDASFHFSKNAPISQRRAPFGILRCVDNGKRYDIKGSNNCRSSFLLNVYELLCPVSICVWIDINIEKVFIWDM